MLGQNVNIRIGGPLTPMVKKLMIINGVVFIVQQIARLMYPGYIENLFGLHHVSFIEELKLWQVFTYMFLHGGWFHIFFNLFALWMFAGELEQLWGGNEFLRYYLLCGIGAGLSIALMNYIVYENYHSDPVTIGASGAIYALLLAYGLNWPDRKVLLYFVIPVKIKYLVIAFGLIEFFGTISTVSVGAGNISHIGHLGGFVSGIVYYYIHMRRPMESRKIGGRRDGGSVAGFFKRARLKKKKKEIETRIRAKKVIDESLEKIARYGMSSLTPVEKKELEWARRHYYPDRDETLH
ncbi:MAG: rhomboid family intramembrane serine protease [Chrysiogenales bacterium]|nr:MAG: rhomboid family intramembrane serine protease [Chrysiogenales bacterium]